VRTTWGHACHAARRRSARLRQALGGSMRYRCKACGNLTRFTVTTSTRTRAYYHFTLEGKLTIEDPEVLEETVEEVACRWCDHGKAIEVIEGPDTG